MRINLIQNIKNLNYRPLTAKPHGYMINSLKNDVFEKSEETSFAGHPCKADAFRVKGLYNIPCPCCGTDMVTNAQLEKFINEVENRTGRDLAGTLNRYEKYYKPVEKEVAFEISKYAEQYPKLNISELTRKISVEHREKLIEEQSGIIEELKGMSSLINNDDVRKIYVKYLERSAENVREFKDDSFFKRKSFLSDLNEICKNSTDEKGYETIMTAAFKMPSSVDSASAFLIKYARRGQEEIARRLLNPSLSTTEHVIPKSRGGENNTGNYIAMCAKCNSSRSSIPYDEWLEGHPDMPVNLQNYLDEVSRRIKEKAINGYDDYPDDVVNVIREESKGQIELEVRELSASDDLFKDIPKTLTKEERLCAMQRRIEKKQEELSELYKIADKYANDEEYLNLSEYFALNTVVEAYAKRRQAASKKLSAAKQSQSIQENRYKKAEEIRKSLETCGLHPKKIMKLKEDLKKVEERIEKHSNAAEQREIAEKEYNEITEVYNEKKKALEELKARITLPEDYNAEISEITKKLQDIHSLKREIYALKEKVAQKDEIQKEKNEIQAQIKQLQYGIMYTREDMSIDKKQESRILAKYDLLTGKMAYLEGLQIPDTLVSSAKLPKGTKPDFIVREAKKSIQSQIDEMLENPIVECRYLEDQMEKLKDKKEDCNFRMSKIGDIEKRLQTLQTELQEYEKDDTEQNLVEKLRKVKSSKNAVETKIYYLNIQKQISVLEELITKYVKEIKRLEESNEE